MKKINYKYCKFCKSAMKFLDDGEIASNYDFLCGLNLDEALDFEVGECPYAFEILVDDEKKD